MQYFDQRLGNAHSKRSLKFAFSMFFMQESWKRKKIKNIEASFLVQYKKICFLINVASISPLFFLFDRKLMKKHILTSIWSMQQANTGWNIQHFIPPSTKSKTAYNNILIILVVSSKPFPTYSHFLLFWKPAKPFLWHLIFASFGTRLFALSDWRNTHGTK